MDERALGRGLAVAGMVACVAACTLAVADPSLPRYYVEGWSLPPLVRNACEYRRCVEYAGTLSEAQGRARQRDAQNARWRREEAKLARLERIRDGLPVETPE